MSVSLSEVQSLGTMGQILRPNPGFWVLGRTVRVVTRPNGTWGGEWGTGRLPSWTPFLHTQNLSEINRDVLMSSNLTSSGWDPFGTAVVQSHPLLLVVIDAESTLTHTPN